MCGIIGINSNRAVSSTIINSLKKLEYRGYDSAGICTLENGSLVTTKCKGKVSELESKLNESSHQGFVGIGHTR